jgi:hypothetical protein
MMRLRLLPFPMAFIEQKFKNCYIWFWCCYGSSKENYVAPALAPTTLDQRVKNKVSRRMRDLFLFVSWSCKLYPHGKLTIYVKIYSLIRLLSFNETTNVILRFRTDHINSVDPTILFDLTLSFSTRLSKMADNSPCCWLCNYRYPFTVLWYFHAFKNTILAAEKVHNSYCAAIIN